jgi:hypothetical protein
MPPLFAEDLGLAEHQTCSDVEVEMLLAAKEFFSDG